MDMEVSQGTASGNEVPVVAQRRQHLPHHLLDFIFNKWTRQNPGAQLRENICAQLGTFRRYARLKLLEKFKPCDSKEMVAVHDRLLGERAVIDGRYLNQR